MINLFRDLPPRADEEVFTELLAREGVRIERIVSTGQSTPEEFAAAIEEQRARIAAIHQASDKKPAQ